MRQNHSDAELLNSARELMQTEAREILAASERLTPDIVKAARLIYQCEGRVVVVGLGKSGHVPYGVQATGLKISANTFHSLKGWRF